MKGFRRQKDGLQCVGQRMLLCQNLYLRTEQIDIFDQLYSTAWLRIEIAIRTFAATERNVEIKRAQRRLASPWDSGGYQSEKDKERHKSQKDNGKKNTSADRISQVPGSMIDL